MNRFHLSAKSGIIAASLAANSVLFAWRNASARKQYITSMAVKWRTLTGYSAEQEISLDVLHVTAFGSGPANFTGGTDLSNYGGTDGAAVVATNAIKPRSHDRNRHGTELRSALETGNVRIATTAGLTPPSGTVSTSTHPMLSDGCLELITGVTVQRGRFDALWKAPTPENGMVDAEGAYPLIPTQGFIITNPIALGAGGTGRLYVEVDWLES